MNNKLSSLSSIAKDSIKSTLIFLAWVVGILTVLAVVGLIVFRLFWVTFVDNYELGFTFNVATGKIQVIDHTGWVIRTPLLYKVHSIDLRPYQVVISANQRVLNAKLVKFNPDGLDTFVKWHGRSAADDTDSMLEILKCYAFDRDDGKDCPFLTVISQLQPNQAAQSAVPNQPALYPSPSK